jgi:hypothetical protein
VGCGGVIVRMCFLFFVRWCFVVCCFGVASLVTLSHSSYRGLVTNKSLVFSSKKVEFPGSLVKRRGIFYRAM